MFMYSYLAFIIFFTQFTHLVFATWNTNVNEHLLRSRRDAAGGQEETLARVREFMREARTESGDVDLSALLARNVDDPVPIEDFNVSSHGFLSDIVGQFADLQLHGLRGFQVDRLAVNLADMNLSAAFSAPLLSIVGRYALDGTVTFFPLSGEGPFYMNLSRISLRGHSLVETVPRLQMGQIELDSDVEEVQVQFDNLMGGGAWGSISNSLLNQLGELILGELKPTMMRELSSYLRHQFDNEVFRQLPPGFADRRSAGVLDAILEHAALLMVEGGVEPLPLPEYKQVYERQVLMFSTRGELVIHNGTLHGLSTLKRRGDVVTVFENNSLVFEADFEFENLTGDYLWQAQALGAEPKGALEIQVKSVEGFVRIKQDMKAGSRLELEDFTIKGIRQIWLDLKGLGTWDYILESVVNLVTNSLKLQIADAITAPVKKSIQEQLDQLNIGISD